MAGEGEGEGNMDYPVAQCMAGEGEGEGGEGGQVREGGKCG